MSDTQEFWRGDFGDQYVKRNRVDWRGRIPFWENVLKMTGARSVFELGTNAGWNLSAIRRIHPDVAVMGVEINEMARRQAQACGLAVSASIEAWPNNHVDLTFTAGVLIHVAPDDLEQTMEKLVNISSQYVMAIEYAAEQEEEVNYRGHTGKLWRRPYGKLYQDHGLKLVDMLPATGFDRCNTWLLEKA